MLRLSIAALALATVSCARAPESPFQTQFTVRARWPGERQITWRIEPDAEQSPPAALEPALRPALAAWSATGCVTFLEAPTGSEADLTFGWRSGAHGSCVPFGPDPGVAHAGPSTPGTFVHFDSARDWGAALSLRQAALHEIGHILGLDHSPDEGAAMYAEPAPERDHLGSSDLAGIHSLYGGGSPALGDLVIAGAGGTLTLYGVAPAGLCGWTLFDTDGDGDDEVVVWRTDADGHGALWTYHFSTGPQLAFTRGPAWGVTTPGFAPGFLHVTNGERLLVLHPVNGRPQARAFDDEGLLTLHLGEIPADARPEEKLESRHGDLDGDGVGEAVGRRGPIKP